MRAHALAAIATLTTATTTAAAQPTPAPLFDVDSTTLPALLAERSFTPPAGFKALIVELRRGAGGCFEARAFDYRGTSRDRDDWWPASTVKLFAAVAVLERIEALGFSPAAQATFHYQDEIGDVQETIAGLVEAAIGDSNNTAYDQLVELVGHDELHRFFVAENGFRDTVLQRSYAHRLRHEDGCGDNRHSPRITLREQDRTRVLPERTGSGRRRCADHGNCTSLAELAEVMRRVMLHEHLAASDRYALSDAALAVLRHAMSHARRYTLAEILGGAFGDVPVEVFHKPGFAAGWVSDVLYVERRDTGERWLVAAAAEPDRGALSDAIGHLGALLASGALARAAHRPAR